MPTRDELRACWDHNPDGAGIMYPAKGNVRAWKGFMEWADFEEALGAVEKQADPDLVPVALHFRIATHGGVKPGCCHPFAVCKDYKAMRKTDRLCKLGFMHNGTLSGLDTGKGVSDSMAFAANVLAPLKSLDGDPLSNKSIERIIAASTQGSRFLLMDGHGDVSIFGEWEQVNGILYSNLNHLRSTYSGSYGQTGLFDAFMGFDGNPTDLLNYGLYEACADCEMLGECMSFAPYCTTAAEAETVSEYSIAG